MNRIRLFNIIVLLALALCLSACAGNPPAVTTGATADATAAPPVTEAPEATTEPAAEPTAEPTEAPTAEPTVSPTSEPTEAPNLLDAGNPDLQKDINIFLSNFAEVFFADYDASGDNEAQMLSFVYSHCIVNDYEALSHEGSYAYISKDKVDGILEKYFGRSIEPEEGQEFQNVYSGPIRYADGRYAFIAAAGESYNRFAVARSLRPTSAGPYLAEFEIFQQEIISYLDSGFNSSFYSLSYADTAKAIADGRIEATGLTGYAYVTKGPDGNYELLQYTVPVSGS